MKRNYIVTRVMSETGTFRGVALGLGNVEIRPPSSDSKEERSCLEASKQHYSLEVNLDGTAMRISALVQAESEEEADHYAIEIFEETQDILDNSSFGMSKFSLMDCGCITDIDGGITKPRFPVGTNAPKIFPTFERVEDLFPSVGGAQYFINLSDSELKMGLLRSFYWSRKARWEPEGQMRLLYRWFAMEAIWLSGKDEDITPRIMWSLGFPNGPQAVMVSRNLITELSAHPTYSSWKGKIELWLREIKVFRNKTVHNGFRPQDLSKKNLEDFNRLTMLACPRVQGFAYRGLEMGCVNPGDLLSKSAEIFNSKIKKEEVHGTILYTLQNPD
ncbi:hypothetical protein [Bdellovibrio bacteriovorus]|uniref:hypothetical protein n=1 Tax=Bdellovibrio bacteriovorus TaxID=959 RepID=UPI0035A58100